MPSNVEIKARVAKDFEELKSIARELSGSDLTLIEQEDTFFNVSNGRLKLREFKSEDRPSELISYVRSNQEAAKFCDYRTTIIEHPSDLKATLSMALGIKGVVKKRRLLALVGQTRIHLDTVEGLGQFLELEVCMKPDQAVEEGEAIAKDLMDKLGVKGTDLVACAYMDLLLQQMGES